MAKYKTFLLIVLLSAAGLIGLSGAFQDSNAAKSINTSDKAAIEEIIADYLRDNPEKIVESLRLAQEREEQKRQANTQQKIESLQSYFASAELPSIGRPNADVTIVEFFDYNCGYCKRALPDVQKIAEKDKNVRFVFMEMPILSQASREAAKWAMAAHNQGKYFEYHAALMNFRGSKNAGALEKMAKDVGLDIDRMKQDVASQAVERKISESLNIAREIGINGTPAFIVNDKLFPGYIGQRAMEQAIKEARES